MYIKAIGQKKAKLRATRSYVILKKKTNTNFWVLQHLKLIKTNENKEESLRKD